jgi:transposase
MAQKIMQPDQQFGSPDDLLAWIKESNNSLEIQRYLSIRMLMTGLSREDVMHMFNLSWSTLQKWVRLWNKGGRESLKVGKPSGRPPMLTEEVQDFIVKKVKFTDLKKGERITGTSISGTLKKNVRDQIEQKLDLQLFAQDRLPKNPPQKDSSKKG